MKTPWIHRLCAALLLMGINAAAQARETPSMRDGNLAPIREESSTVSVVAQNAPVAMDVAREAATNERENTALKPRSITLETAGESAATPDANAANNINSSAQHSDATAPNAVSTAIATDEAGSAEPADDDEVIADDPYEAANRAIFQFNDRVDRALVKPVAKTYRKVTPSPLRRCATNFFDNLSTPYTCVNNLLQGKPKAALQDLGRFVANTIVGVGGCRDVATEMGLPKHHEDFGQTLAVWGVPSGPFVMLPGFGPSTVRDTLSKPVDIIANPIGYLHNIRWRNSLQGYKLLDTRTQLLETTDVIDASALDPYVMTRDGWLQYRAAQIKDEDGTYAPTIEQEQPRAAGSGGE